MGLQLLFPVRVVRAEYIIHYLTLHIYHVMGYGEVCFDNKYKNLLLSVYGAATWTLTLRIY